MTDPRHSPAESPLADSDYTASPAVVWGIGAVVAAYSLWLMFWAAAPPAEAAEDRPADHQAAASENERDSEEAGESEESHGPAPAFFSIIPFIAMLGSIAILPLFNRTEHWWEHNRNRLIVAVGLALLTLFYYAFLYGHGVVDHFGHEHAVSERGLSAAWTVLKNAMLVEYVPFIVLLFSLYVISGGIHIQGSLVGTPRLNTQIILLGGALASFIGTTGAAMLLIRPLIRANRHRQHVAHTVVFFIFVVCNTGGCLLPIGDPPLFLGYLRGVPFLWTLNLWPMWLLTGLGLGGIYFAWDVYRYRGELVQMAMHPGRDDEDEEAVPLAIEGALNFAWLVGVILCVALLDPARPVPGTEWHAPVFLREVVMLGLTALSLMLTSTEIRRSNVFNYDAIGEVAALFIGIFICMQAPIQILNEYGPELGLNAPWKYFWGSGVLSSFLDNAPTYVVFFETARTVADPHNPALVAHVTPIHLVAVSLGSVFMGSMTYIGNGPNFMVKAIAEQSNIRMPSFFGYMIYSCAFVLPMCIVICVVFLR